MARGLLLFLACSFVSASLAATPSHAGGECRPSASVRYVYTANAFQVVGRLELCADYRRVPFHTSARRTDPAGEGVFGHGDGIARCRARVCMVVGAGIAHGSPDLARYWGEVVFASRWGASVGPITCRTVRTEARCERPG